MKNILTALVLISSLQSALAGWENPAVMCPEDSFSKGISCFDLSGVQDPLNDFPSQMSADVRTDWTQNFPVDLKLCRHREILRRESIRPGTFTPLQIQIAWMVADGGNEANAKYNAVIEASKKHGIPPQTLIGAITQESLLASLGISPDGDNYSCGIAQLNISEWCGSLPTLPASEVASMGWPKIACSNLSPTMIKPFYEMASKKLGKRPAYQINAKDFEGITFDQVASRLPVGTPELQQARFQAITSFIRNCQKVSTSISLKANTLKGLFNQFVPKPLRDAEIYSQGSTHQRSCAQPYPSKYYPLHTGWLLAIAMYNAGPVQSKVLEHYYQVRDRGFPQMNPLDLIEALHWGGSARAGTTRIYFTGQNDQTYSQLWYKACVVQRHIARVVQHVSLPGQTIARSLEQAACGKGEVPAYRRNSSGIKN